MTFRARLLAIGLAGAVCLLVAMVMLSIFLQFSQTPAVVQWTVSVLVVAATAWRVVRVAVVATDDALILRNVVKDAKIPWDDVVDIRVEQGAAVLGHTALPVIQTTSGEREVPWLAGYSFGKQNRRVIRQTDALREYWQART